VFASALVLLFSHALNGFAQDAAQTPAPAHLAYVDGVATLEREGEVETAMSGMPFVPGDRLQTKGGRIEVLFPEGTALAVDEYTTIEMQDRSLLRMAAGRVFLTVAGVKDPANAVRYQIDTPSASAATDGPGEYRVATMNGRGAAETELAVYRGYATLETDIGSTAVRAGERTLARDLLAPSQPLLFNSARFDAFDSWARARRDARLGTTSTQYLPRDLYAYSSTFDRHGTWGHHAQYGPVWYPTVTPGWRPYYYGHWSPVPAYGWTWIGYDAWGWPTHHYGRWGFAGGHWFWAPGRTWGGAWVSWASAPGYVGWCPVGYCGGVGFSFGVSFGGPWNGWVVVGTPYFGHGHRYPVYQHVVSPYAIPYSTPFTVHARAPLAPPAAAPRPRAIPRPGAGGPQIRASERAAPGRQPMTVPGGTSPIPLNQPELGLGRAVSRSQQPSATTALPTGGRQPGARTRAQLGSPGQGVNAEPNRNRYVPETRTLGGRPAAVPRQATPAAPPANDAAAGSRWYPPTTRPRGIDVPSPAFRTAPGRRSLQQGAPAPNPTVQPRRSAAPPAASAVHPPQISRPAPASRGSVGAPLSGMQPRGPAAVPRGAAPGRAPQAAPAQPPSRGGASAPAGARSPRSR
jgi:hypothetical protein